MDHFWLSGKLSGSGSGIPAHEHICIQFQQKMVSGGDNEDNGNEAGGDDSCRGYVVSGSGFYIGTKFSVRGALLLYVIVLMLLT